MSSANPATAEAASDAVEETVEPTGVPFPLRRSAEDEELWISWLKDAPRAEEERHSSLLIVLERLCRTLMFLEEAVMVK